MCSEITGTTEFLIPKKLDLAASKLLIAEMRQHYPAEYADLSDLSWTFYAVDQKRGRCYFHSRVITIPLFALFKRSITYKQWYIAHEMAHAFCVNNGDYEANHGPRFMQELKRICKPEAIRHELGYKPRNAAAAGILNLDLSEI